MAVGAVDEMTTCSAAAAGRHLLAPRVWRANLAAASWKAVARVCCGAARLVGAPFWPVAPQYTAVAVAVTVARWAAQLHQAASAFLAGTAGLGLQMHPLRLAPPQVAVAVAPIMAILALVDAVR